MIPDIDHPPWCERQLLCSAHRQNGRHMSAPWVIHDVNGSTGTVWAEQSPGGQVLALSRVDGTLSSECRARFDLMAERAEAFVRRLNGA